MRWTVGTILVALILAGSFVYTKREREQEQQLREQAYQREVHELNSRIDEMAAAHGATRRWAKTLVGDDGYRSGSVMNIELEAAWIEEGPIVFLGTVKDIRSVAGSKYVVRLEWDWYSSSATLYGTSLMLSLEADKATIDAFVEKHEEVVQGDFGNTVAALAKIKTIESRIAGTADGEATEVRIGHGTLLELVFVGDVAL